MAKIYYKNKQDKRVDRRMKYMRRLRYGTYKLLSDIHLHDDRMPAPSHQPIDVVIPVVDKDLDILPLSLEGLRTMCTNHIADIYLVGRDTESIRNAAKSLNCKFVDELSILGYGVLDIPGAIAPDGTSRKGWIFQQLLKLSGAIGTCRHFLVIDSDHILIQPHTFLAADGKSVLYLSKEYHGTYFRSISGLMGPDFSIAPLSFIAHKMLFDREQLSTLRHTLEQRRPDLGDSWDRIILSSLDMSEGVSPFSEFELYGNFLPASEKQTLLWRQKALHKVVGDIPEYSYLLHRYQGRYRSVTFPDYKKKKVKI